ncbi:MULTISPECIES: pantoate--beta-alanine ligase [Nitrincola]|uniref:Pantothenate synthetase n=1 Tax=Nitrincola nitratireducens TaxID=1229521 RepID=W9UQ08_9GAMM|nr:MULTISPECIES: pantoate--beta-alanine ligase [Nitrincola]EXJ09293.1 Pantothenate synthetase [Nitrincola nitratireducens]
MQTIITIDELRSVLTPLRRQGLRIALVPTMGNLHAGHIRLVEEAVKKADIVVASIFVNPLQFGANEDLDKYPRTLDADKLKLESAGCSFLFTPSDQEIYPEGRNTQTLVEVPGLSELYCGHSRPGHFVGVATVVCKLFNIVQPDIAFFGKKDFQQLRVIRKMVADLCIPIEIVGIPIVRADSGLALSSRNGYLSAEELTAASQMHQVLLACSDKIHQGERSYRELEDSALTLLEKAGFKRDYLRIVRQEDLLAAQADDTKLVILAAAYMGHTRLIDNVEIDL